MVTRTVIGTKATVKTIELSTDKIITREVMLSKTFDDGAIDKVKRAVEKVVNVQFPTEAVVAVLSFTKDEKLYGVDESVFMAHAVELDKETRKPLNVPADGSEQESTEV